MTDLELLELAAKAAGITNIKYITDKGVFYYSSIEEDNEQRLQLCIWAPHLNDGDAFRLAVKLRLSIHLDCIGPIEVSSFKHGVRVAEENRNLATATRRAIVRAAAEIGKEMK